MILEQTRYNTRKHTISYKQYETTILTIEKDHIGETHRFGLFYEAQKGQALDFLYNNYSDYLNGGCFIDVGAHVGNHSLFFNKVLNMSGIAIEANIHLYPILGENLTSTPTSVIPFFAACHEHAGLFYEFREAPDYQHNSGMGRIELKPSALSSKTQTTLTIDLFSPNLVLHPHLIKIDVENVTEEVMYGAEETIKKFRPIVIVEMPYEEADDLPFLEMYRIEELTNYTETVALIPQEVFEEKRNNR